MRITYQSSAREGYNKISGLQRKNAWEEWLEDDSQKWYTDGTRTLQEVGVEIVGPRAMSHSKNPQFLNRTIRNTGKCKNPI
ncbi:hypothetical protein EVAR_101106_1 [Eumeta japonica]|uniref:Uncharacterized protein n=1 Tax=Eumeta variegata TaxID=151549 RepID=A0A4C1SB73_EUMVA|nr:hypothetical protein EVAR_101106_1 [Eumeta japonica]